MITSTKRTGFNNGANGDIDLKDYDAIKRPTQHGAQFVKFDFLDLRNLDLTDSNLSNKDVRAEGTTRERVEELRNEFATNGWSTKYYPPIVDTSNKIRDGRGRVWAAKENGEIYMPVAVFSYSDNSVKTTSANGILVNWHPPATKAKPDDFRNACIAAIRQGEMGCDVAEIEEYLINHCGIERFWSRETGQMGKIVKAVQREIAAGNSTMVIRDTDGWKEWFTERNGEDKSVVVLKVGNTNIPQRAVCEYILPWSLKGKAAPKFALYSNNPNPKGAHKELKYFVKQLNTFYESMYNMINKDFFGGNMQKYKTDKDKQILLSKKKFSVIGAFPQFSEYHDIDGCCLVEIEKYLDK